METWIINILAPLLTGLLGWFTGRAKTKQEVKAMAVDNEMKTAKYYQDILDDMTERLQKAMDNLMKCEAEYEKIIAENRKLIRQNQQLIKQNKELIDANEVLIGELKKLKEICGKETPKKRTRKTAKKDAEKDAQKD